ncbi:4-diphosphocytidyl-2-C-methyl-D-erythritol kinase [Litoreibacter ascidiaceicola]|uniref:4-diphosphocytidyl-2-C-methyl-D-erythritol kinase n=1 Tax=Litoreibacter ascidiaceicola TaxID=1486859 RepID=A0A1M4XB41_9RHOB|nr:4-(cytidine 5'-diphospho)-2-C-methyl-D-erythritol kinase [Litoreibacter ascidiaceicola]SHE90621.1 4-diphosphocytidyl-2-C-methyl-D-erythritol kinase [Litoreibacter ascidiaceicola]
MLEQFAPAKVNLTLHVTGQSANGYHLLDSLVMFASVGDHLTFEPADALSLTIDGPESGAIPTDGNSVLSAAHLIDPQKSAHIHLTKILPVASGIGGGTADAAAAYRGLSKLWGLPDAVPGSETFAHVAKLGADVPICLFSQTARMSGIGEKIEFMPDLPALDAVLVNPRVEVSTPAVFKAISSKNNASMRMIPSNFIDQTRFITWLRHQRNDMQDAAVSIAPMIENVLSALWDTKNCQLARMSGSGATCFGVFPSAETARYAALQISREHPDWWVKPCALGA